MLLWQALVPGYVESEAQALIPTGTVGCNLKLVLQPQHVSEVPVMLCEGPLKVRPTRMLEARGLDPKQKSMEEVAREAGGLPGKPKATGSWNGCL